MTLPQASASFFGRAAVLDALSAAVSNHRVVTIRGPGGVGKTQLLLRWAAHTNDRHLSFCDLSELMSAEELLGGVASALHLQPDGRPLERAVLQTLTRDARVLLLLDNAEHLLAPTASLVTRMLESAPALKIVLTSREALRLNDEHVLDLQPLPLAEAVALFEARVRRFGEVAPEDLGAVRDIVERVDCLPLGIELAAARALVVSPRELADMLGRDLEVLRGGRAGRHATMRAAVEWSWKTLSAEQQRLFRRASVFHGGFTAAALSHLAEVEPASGDTLDALQALVERSLLRRHQSKSGIRFHFLHSILNLAEQKLAEVPEERAVCERAHLLHYARWAETQLDAAGGARSEAVEALLGLEAQNLARAFRHAQTHAPELCPKLALALAAGSVSQADLSLPLLALHEAEAHADQEWRLALLLARAKLLRRNCQHTLARATVDNGVSLATDAPIFLGRFFGVKGRLARDFGQFDDALAAAREAERLARVHDEGQLALVLSDRAWAERDAALFFEATTLIGKNGPEPRLEAGTFCMLGSLTAELGRASDARRYLARAVSVARAVDDPRLVGTMLTHQAIAELLADDLIAARASLTEAKDVLQRSGHLFYECIVEVYSGIVERVSGNLGAAEQSLREGLTLARAFGSKWTESWALAHLGTVLAESGLVAEAAGTLGDAQAMGAGFGGESYQRYLELQGVYLHVAETVAAQGAARDRALKKCKRAFDLLEPFLLGTYASAELRSAHMALARTLLRLGSTSAERQAGIRCEVSRDGAWAMLEDGTRVVLDARKPIQRLLQALAENHVQTPDRALAAAELIQRIWPDEQLLDKSAKNRLQNAISTLRKAGLGAYLLTRSDGYLLDARLRIVLI